MNRRNIRRVATTIMAAGALVISGCSSEQAGSVPATSSAAAAVSSVAGAVTSSGGAAVSNSASVGSTTAPAASGSSEASDSAGSSSAAPTSAPASSTASSSPTAESSASVSTSSAAESSTATATSRVAAVTDVAGLTVLAKKLGCTAPAVKATKPGTPGDKAGATAVTTCKANGAEYLLAATKNPAGVPALVKVFGETVGGGSKVFYVVGSTWFALGTRTGNDAPESVAKEIQDKIGGEVKSVD